MSESISKRHSLAAVIAAACVVSISLLPGCGLTRSSDPQVARADSLVQAAVDEGTVSGAVLMVMRNGVDVHKEAYGYGEQFGFDGGLVESPVEMTTEHVFDLASLTKVFATTLGIMKLVDDERVELNAPVNNYLPAFSGLSKDSVTVQHLLSHSSGLSQWKPLYYHANSSAGVLEYVSELPLEYPVGKQRRYSDLGFMLLGYVIEAVTREPLDRYLDHAIYRPLRLQATGFAPLSQPRFGARRYAATSHGNPFERKMVADDDFGYRCDEDVDDFQNWRQYVLVGEVNDGNAFHANQSVAGHAGLFSTVTDLSVLLRMVTNLGEVAGTPFIGRRTVERFLTKGPFGHGLGWALSSPALPVDNLPEGSFGHTGFTGTFAISMPAAGISVILLTNRQHAGVDSTGRYPDLGPLRRAVVGSFL